jgi:hypothetical protein
MIRPFVRRLRPDDHLADRFLDEESRISDALSNAVRAAAHATWATGSGLRDTGDRPLPAARNMTSSRSSAGACRCRSAGRLGRGPRCRGGGRRRSESAGPGGQARGAVAQTADRVRDALAGFS